MRSAIAHAAVAAQRTQKGRQRSKSLSTIPPSASSEDYLPHLAAIAASILYRSPLPSRQGRPIYVLNAAAFPDAFEVDYDTLLSYVLARLPGEDELLSGTEYEIVFLAGGQPDNATSEKKSGPGMGWYLQAYHVLSRATRKRLQRLYIVHPRTWVRVLIGVFGTIVSPKFRRKIVHFNTLSQLALQIPIERLLIPPTAYLHDRKQSPDIYAPFVTGKRAFGVRHPFPKNIDSGKSRLPRILRETTSFLMMPPCIKMEGIFRIPPNATLGAVLKEAYDRGQHFIVWKEPGATVVQPGMPQTLLDEVRLEDAYGAHQAASLIKQWYRDLRDPVFPESSYAAIKEQYGSPDVDIQPEDLVNLILPASDLSPLSKESREILTRHLLPMLSEVAAYETQNKMSPENLAICFSMCLVCGSNQLEDAKISSIVKRIMKAAIEMWPELQAGMDISANAFFQDLQAPADSRDYEDPLEEELPPRSKIVDDDDFPSETYDGQRIVMHSEDLLEPERKPTLPPRPSREALPALAPVIPSRRPVSRPASSGNSSPTKTTAEVAPPFPKRKPAPPTLEPPRYSTVFDVDGNSIHVADSPVSYVPVDGFGPPRRGAWSYDEPEKKGFVPESSQPAPIIEVPKRKAVSGEHNSADNTLPPSNATSSVRSASDSASLAQQAAQRGAANLAQQAASAFAERQSSTPALQNPEEVITQSLESANEDESIFRKPSWPASSRPLIQPQSLAKPLFPPRHSNTFPLQSNNNLATISSNVPKHRAPSPGLLKRVSEMEVSGSGGTSTENPAQGGASSLKQPRRLDLKKPSVEDLRRLYEERATTVEGLAKADAARRSSTST